MRFADKSLNIHVADYELLPSDAASFEPSQASLSFKQRLRSSAPEPTRKRHRALKARSPKSRPQKARPPTLTSSLLLGGPRRRHRGDARTFPAPVTTLALPGLLRQTV